MNNSLLIGRRNSGKSTTIYASLKKAQLLCGGVISLPVFRCGYKIGADALDVSTGEKQVLTRLSALCSPSQFHRRRYLFNPAGINLGRSAIKRAIGKCDLVIVDEIGPLELRGHKGWLNEAEDALRAGNSFIVIRESLRKEFFQRYGTNFDIVKKNSLPEIFELKR